MDMQYPRLRLFRNEYHPLCLYKVRTKVEGEESVLPETEGEEVAGGERWNRSLIGRGLGLGGLCSIICK